MTNTASAEASGMEASYGLPTLVDMTASEKLTRRQRRWFNRKRSFKNWDEQAFFDEVEQHLCTCESPAVAMQSRAVFSMHGDNEADQITFGLDPDRLSEFLDVIYDFIINKLPKIAETLVKILSLFSVALVLAVPTTANAMEFLPPSPFAEMDSPSMAPPEMAELTVEESDWIKDNFGADVPKHVLAQFEDCPGGVCPLNSAPAIEQVQSPQTMAEVSYSVGPMGSDGGFWMTSGNCSNPNCSNPNCPQSVTARSQDVAVPTESRPMFVSYQPSRSQGSYGSVGTGYSSSVTYGSTGTNYSANYGSGGGSYSSYQPASQYSYPTATNVTSLAPRRIVGFNAPQYYGRPVARVTTAPVRFVGAVVRNRPVANYFANRRPVVRLLNAVRPVNVVGRMRSRMNARMNARNNCW